MCHWPLRPILVYYVDNYRLHLSHFCANMTFSRSHFSHLLFGTYLILSNENHLPFTYRTIILRRLLTVNIKNCPMGTISFFSVRANYCFFEVQYACISLRDCYGVWLLNYNSVQSTACNWQFERQTWIMIKIIIKEDQSSSVSCRHFQTIFICLPV